MLNSFISFSYVQSVEDVEVKNFNRRDLLDKPNEGYQKPIKNQYCKETKKTNIVKTNKNPSYEGSTKSWPKWLS
jgi:hypothetical protein